jgi:hypothetical protein
MIHLSHFRKGNLGKDILPILDIAIIFLRKNNSNKAKMITISHTSSHHHNRANKEIVIKNNKKSVTYPEVK